MNAQLQDQGLERMPEQFRDYCWGLALRATGREWDTFKSMAMQMHFGGVSSEAEAKRLFMASQIIDLKFFDLEAKPSSLATQLSDDIQSGFQHASRPISVEADPERQLIDILNYYFPSEAALERFNQCLLGAFDSKVGGQEAEWVFHEQGVGAQVFHEQSSGTQVFREQGGQESQWQQSTKPFTESKKGALNNDDATKQKERSRVIEYIEARDKGLHYPELSDKIKKIIDGFYRGNL